ncbi:MAG: mannitol dehydrogenase family protein [Treponema sp.]|nr:mannitol dehydrogenase family protein [Candidatus Treponema equifaecale]
MKLNLKELADKSKWNGYKLFDFDYAKVSENTKKSPEWVHFGGGNIFRIFPAALCQKLLNEGLMNTGIVVGNSHDPEIIDILYKAHDNLTLGVTLKADGSISKEVIGSIAWALNCDPELKDDWAEFEKIFTNPSLKMVSFTITEKGYALYGPDGKLLPAYVEDFATTPENAKMFMCHLTRLLFARFKAGQLPVTMVSMDNCSHNGEKLQSAIVEIAENWCKKGYVPQEFIEYLKNDKKVAFPWSMIDKITPRPDAKVAEMLKKDGFEDTELMVTSRKTYISPFVNAEEPQYLVIEDKFPNGRPPLEKAGVYFTDRDTVNKVEKMKVCTCLNPLHTSLAVSGCLLGFNLICDEMKDSDLKKMVEILGYEEGLPVVVDPKIIEPKSFIDEVITKRLPNPFMPDTPQRIATDTSQKLSIRFGETVKAYQSKGLDLNKLKIVPLVFAMWARYLLAVDDDGKAFELSPDPLIPSVKPILEGIEIGGKNADAEEKFKKLLANEKIFGFDVTSSPLYQKSKEYFLAMVSGKGMVRKTIHEAVN